MGFFTNHYCSDCANMREDEVGKGKFLTDRPCPQKEVYADRYAGDCSQFCTAFSRSSGRKEELYMVSRRAHFIVTAICDILNLGDDNKYHDSFEYVREVYIPQLGQEGDIFMEEYEELGPIAAENLRKEENATEYAEYLQYTYLESFSELVKANKQIQHFHFTKICFLK